jgi:hypothetical protein
MIDIIIRLGLALFVAASAAAVAYYVWDQYKDKIASWLRQNGLERSALMSAFLQFDKIASRIRQKLVVSASSTGAQIIEEKELSAEEIAELFSKEPQVADRLRDSNRAELDLISAGHV